MTGAGPSGQLTAAVTALVDAIFAVLLALGVIHVRPDSAMLSFVVAAGFNLAAYVLAYIQHQQHTTKLQLLHNEKMLNQSGRVT